jgi:hypothetical protein
MVAKIITGKHIRGILSYNEHKVGKGTAEILLAENFTAEASRLSLTNKLSHFEAFVEKNRRTKTNAIHISLNFDASDKLDNELLKELSEKYMTAIGFEDQPYLLYRHYDAAHPHVHIVTTNIQSNGQRIDLHNIGKNQSETARKSLEKEYSLVEAESKGQRDNLPVNQVDIQRALYGKDETKQAIANVVRSVTRNWKYTSLPELNAVLRQYNVIADRGSEDSKMFQKNGLLYRILDKQGKKIGVPIKASSIYGKPTLKFLENRYKLNEELRKPYKLQLKQAIDFVLLRHPTKVEFEQTLAGKGIQVVYRKNEEGRIYGITFTDHKSKSVFNGSALGKAYSAKALTDGFTTAVKSESKIASPFMNNFINQTGFQKFSDKGTYSASHILEDLLNGYSAL